MRVKKCITASSAFFSNITRWGGGAIHNAGESTLRIESSTFSENTGIDGGAILISDDSRVEIVNNTIRDNTGAGIQTEDNPTVDIVNTLITGGLDNGCVNGGGQITGHHNLGSETSCPGTEILHGVASDTERNGGPTVTYALPSNSNAIDAGDPALCPETDQRGATRVGVCDIGAFEYDGNLDGDGDGVDTTLDNCPVQANPSQENADGDGLGDVCDACPNAAGFKDGCPDADGDGIQDAEDECPNEWGIPASNGCLVTGSVQGNVNLREGPGTNFNIVGATTSGEEIALIGRNAAGDWLRVRTLPSNDQEAIEAWIFAELVTTEVATDELPIIE